jgi:hypothetical protein
MMPNPLPVAVTAGYQKGQFATGLYNVGEPQVFPVLVNPPASGVASEEASAARATAEGFTGADPADCVQTITINGPDADTPPDGGTWGIAWGGAAATLDFDASSGDIQDVLDNAPGARGTGNVTVSGSAPEFEVTFSGKLSNMVIQPIGANGVLLTPPGCSVDVAMTTPGTAGISDSPDNWWAGNAALQAQVKQYDPMRNFGDSSSGNNFG